MEIPRDEHLEWPEVELISFSGGYLCPWCREFKPRLLGPWYGPHICQECREKNSTPGEVE